MRTTVEPNVILDEIRRAEHQVRWCSRFQSQEARRFEEVTPVTIACGTIGTRCLDEGIWSIMSEIW